MGTSVFQPSSQRGVDSTPTTGSPNLITSGGVYTALSGKQDEITASGVLIGAGSGSVSSKTLDTSTLTNDNDHIPTSGVVKSALSTYAATGVNQNIIDNPTFLINQRGITTGIASGAYGPDRWIVYNSQSENVTIQNGAVLPVNGSVLQRLDAVTIAALTGRTVTASALIEQNGSLSLISGTVASFSASGASQYFTLQNLSILLLDSYTRSIQFFANSACTLKAAKLELGDTQTLAHQENGVWVLNEIPDFQTELFKCQTSTADSYDLYANQTVMTNQRVANPNLLDNWYFVGGGSQQGGGQFPINQRGKTRYHANAYCIDRWMLGEDLTASLDVDGIHFARGSASGGKAVWQTLEKTRCPVGTTVTFSLFGTLTGVASMVLYDANYTQLDAKTLTNEEHGKTLVSWTVSMPANSTELWRCFIYFISGTTSVLKAVKLEIGDTQTLAHQENGAWVLNEIPNFQQELVKCQRYQIVFSSTSSETLTFTGGCLWSSDTLLVPLYTTPMRTLPTTSLSGAIVVGSATARSVAVLINSNGILTLQIIAIGLSPEDYYRIWLSADSQLILDANL